MDIFDNIGQGVENLFNRAVDMGHKVNISAKEAQKISKIRGQLKEEERVLEDLFGTLGEAYYMEMRDQAHKLDVRTAELLLQIDQVIEGIERLENLLKYRELEEAEKNGIHRCYECGALLDEGDKFCSSCGARVLDLDEEDFIEAEVRPQTRTCLHCSYEMDEEASFCPRCGSQVEDFDEDF